MLGTLYSKHLSYPKKKTVLNPGCELLINKHPRLLLWHNLPLRTDIDNTKPSEGPSDDEEGIQEVLRCIEKEGWTDAGVIRTEDAVRNTMA